MAPNPSDAMSQPPDTIPPRAHLEKAADLRAAGLGWDKIAGAVHREASEVESWPVLYRDLWDPLFLAANRRLAAEAEAEGRAILRKDLRVTEDKERRDIAKKLIDTGRRSAAGQPAAASSEVQHLADYLGSLSHDQLRTHLEELLADLEGDRDHDRAGPPVD
jgi:hypothetical protein